MQQKISRRKIAAYVVKAHQSGVSFEQLVKEVAAYLVATNRTREADLVVRAIEERLAANGAVVARVTVARPIDETLRREIAEVVHATQLHVDEIVDPSIIGGVRIETPGKLLDATLKRKLLALRQAKL